MPDQPDPSPLFADAATLALALQALPDIARLLFAYYSALVEQGFTEDQAMMLVIEYQQGFMFRE